MPDPRTFPEAKAAALALHQAATALDAAIAADQGKVAIAGAAEYLAAGAKGALARAQQLLAKDHYKLCFAGGFSAGKSTTINALLGDPDLLPTAAGECTLAITVMTGPLGGRELIRVKYFPREIALRNVVFHQKRYRNAFKQFDGKLKNANAEALQQAVKDVIEWLPGAHKDAGLSEPLRKEYDANKATKFVGELAEFLSYLDKYASRCGNLIEDEIANRAFYLTYDDKQGGLGHLFMIDQVMIHRKNILFEEKAIQIVDLPGIDSTNSYARQVTLDYLKEADLVISVLPPQGFTMSYIDIINEIGAAYRGNIANKMFYVINRFDSNEDRNFTKKELESLLRDQIAAEIDKNGLNSKNLFATCALLDIYRLRGKTESYEALLKANDNKIKAMVGTDEPWASIARNALIGKGIEVVRSAILKYLEEELAFERLRDVQMAVREVTVAADVLLARNSVVLEQARSRRQSAIGQMRDFVIKTQQNFEAAVAGLANALPTMVGNAIQTQLKPQVVSAVGMFRKIELGKPDVQVRFTGAQARSQAPREIKQHWIDWAKATYSDKFTELAHQTIVGAVNGLIDQQVAASRADEVLKHISAASDKDLAAPVRAAIAQAKQNIDALTRLRADEETWPLRRTPVTPTGLDAGWTPAVESGFKEDVVGNLTKVLGGAADKLGSVLGSYYQAILRGLVADFKARSDELEAAIRGTADLDLPMHLVEGGSPDPDEQKRKRLLAYADLREKDAAADARLAKACA